MLSFGNLNRSVQSEPSEADRLRDQVDTLQQALASASEGEQVLEVNLQHMLQGPS